MTSWQTLLVRLVDNGPEIEVNVSPNSASSTNPDHYPIPWIKVVDIPDMQAWVIPYQAEKNFYIMEIWVRKEE